MFKNILVPIDLRSEASPKKSLPIAGDLARHYGARLIVLYVVPDVWATQGESAENRALTQRIRDITNECLGSDTAAQILVRHHNSPHRCIREVAGEVGADLIVMTSHDPALRDLRLGSNATQVVHHAACSVLVLR